MQFDYIIEGGTIVDGTGRAKSFPADVGIVGDTISAVGKLDAAEANQRIDALGKIVSPGFIDVHVHSEVALLGGRDKLAGIQQGVTTQ